MKRLKQIVPFLFLVIGLGAGVRAAVAVEAMHHVSAVRTTFDMPLAEGLVRKVDKAAGKLTLTHGPLPNGMSGMTMTFKVKDVARLGGLKEGQKVLFAVDDALIIVRLDTVE